MRILFVNSARPVFGAFLIFTIGAAIAIESWNRSDTRNIAKIFTKQFGKRYCC